MILIVSFLIANCSAAIAVGTIHQEPEENWLEIESKKTTKKVEINGRVTEVKKYSFGMVEGPKNYTIKVDRRTQFNLRCNSPRIDFEKNVAAVRVEGGSSKLFREYSFEEPLYLVATFAHQNQFKRWQSSSEKRTGNFRISATESNDLEKTRISIRGQLSAGDTDRKVTLKSGSQTEQIILAKNGLWTGFSLSTLEAEMTEVRVNGIETDEGVSAFEVEFWPIAQSANER